MITKRFITVTTLAALAFFLLGLFAAIQSHAYTILVYGLETCGYTQAMRDDLTHAKYKFTFYDVKNDTRLEEMWAKVRTVCPLCEVQGSVKLPVLDVNGQVFIRPSFEQVKQAAGAP